MAHAQRKKEYIDAYVQGALARRIIVHWLVFLLIATLGAFVLQVLSNPFQPLTAHLHVLSWTHGPFLLMLMFLLPVFVVDTIKISHRFAGPIYNLRRALREIAQGKPARKLKFRRHDFWKELADDYNAMLLRLELLDDNGKPAEADEQLVGTNE